LLTACAPELNWRDVRVEPSESALAGLWPCKPDREQRTVPLAGQSVVMTMQSCTAGGAVFAVSAVRLGDPAAVRSSLSALAQGFHHNLGVASVAEAQPFAPVGATPQPEAGLWILQVQSADSAQARVARMAVFSRGTWVFQALVTGRAEDVKSGAPGFLESLRFVP
jgi:hypothetical protein